MLRSLSAFWRDEQGSMAVEWAFLATILVLGAVTGIIAMRQAEPSPDDRPALTAPSGSKVSPASE
jgi:Flp pilus assembly pilin Flp